MLVAAIPHAFVVYTSLIPIIGPKRSYSVVALESKLVEAPIVLVVAHQPFHSYVPNSDQYDLGAVQSKLRSNI